MASSLFFHISLVCIFILILTPISTDAICKWYGIAPFCFIGNSCPDGCFKTSESNEGDGATCWFSQKKLCCCLKRALDSIVNSIVSDDKK